MAEMQEIRMTDPIRDRVRLALQSLPDNEEMREFEKAATNLAVDGDTMLRYARPEELEAEKEQLSAYMQAVQEILREGRAAPLADRAEEQICYGAFCVMYSHYRRSADISKLYKLTLDYKSRFDAHPHYHHMYIMALMNKDPVGNAEQILTGARKNWEQMPGNAGVVHMMADAVATVYETTEFSHRRERLEQERAEWLDAGLKAVREAQELDPGYAKFYCTCGRLLALQGSYDEALRDIKQAIDRESSAQRDYQLRISEYRMHYQLVKIRQTAQSIKNEQQNIKSEQQKMDAVQQQRLEEQTKGVLTKNMEFLGLFAGIVSFTIGSISIAGAMAEKSFLGAAGLIVVLFGAMLGAFAGFGIILHGYKVQRRGKAEETEKTFSSRVGAYRNAVVGLAGIAMILLGSAVCILADRLG